MIRAVCVRECTWQGRYWCKGDLYEGPDTPPAHFRIETIETAESQPAVPPKTEAGKQQAASPKAAKGPGASLPTPASTPKTDD
jgi:hypothetical protein